MCGHACWSKRLYDALALGAVPIIVADGAIQAFERFLDWRRFSIKVSVPELFQDQFTYRFRHILRRQADLFRRGTRRYFPSGFVPYSPSASPSSSFKNNNNNNSDGDSSLSSDRQRHKYRQDVWRIHSSRVDLRGHPQCLLGHFKEKGLVSQHRQNPPKCMVSKRGARSSSSSCDIYIV